jgi:predicted RNA-binding Zn-ribbon protein involved in translation (DUF1610 family)
MSKTTKDVKITNRNCVGLNEWYDYLFKCPNCKTSDIWRDFKYCPQCGVKIEWKFDYEKQIKKDRSVF